MTSRQKELIEEVKNKLIDYADNYDTETAHWEADKCLCELLIAFGMKDVVDLYDKIDKWYA